VEKRIPNAMPLEPIDEPVKVRESCSPKYHAYRSQIPF